MKEHDLHDHTQDNDGSPKLSLRQRAVVTVA